MTTKTNFAEASAQVGRALTKTTSALFDAAEGYFPKLPAPYADVRTEYINEYLDAKKHLEKTMDIILSLIEKGADYDAAIQHVDDVWEQRCPVVSDLVE